ncbi:GntR family transcriptional regulator [Fibrella aquatilis]|uniref:GntR family transcriptional regulator n=1 Tax=Fibrella aquatilis TaxID=2817059 RepID=A0A939GC40_9BACT|nr:GntR family transcriptional regulator [Fibrella aquatilis]MBO0933872.1 GntR family transcriptional regulator [Fibrella aquatilis]
MKSDATLLDQNRSPKYLQVVNAIVRDIEKGVLSLGDQLPSINEACAAWYLSKDSVKRAYETLYQQGFITSINRKGFFIAGQSKRHALRVLMVAGQLTDSVKQLHDAITTNLNRDVILDICSYNYQRQLLCQLLGKHLGDYHYFVLMPHLVGQDPATLQCLRNVPGQQLILIGNQWQDVLQHGHQLRFGGETALYEALQSKLSTLRKYSRLNLILPEHDCFDAESIRAFQRFCITYQFDFQLIDELLEADMQSHEAYFVADSRHLIALVDYSQRSGLQLGQDLGIVSFVENEYTRLLAGGVSVIAHPSAAMGRLVAQILSGQPSACTTPHSLPLQLQFRASC